MQSHAVKCLDTSSGPKRFTFKSISQRIEEIEVNVYRSLDPIRSEPKTSSFFLDSLMHWRELNTAEDFISFYEEMMPVVQTLPQILFHKEKIFSELLQRVNMKAKLSLEPILMLFAALSRDILEEFLPFLKRLIASLVVLLRDGGQCEPDILEQVFTSWQHILMYLQKYLVKDVVGVLETTCPLRLYENYYVQGFMAEAVSFLLRTSPMDELEKGMRKIILEVAEDPTSIKKTGATALIFHVLRGTSSSLRSTAEKVFCWLIGESFLSSSEGLEAVLEVTTNIIAKLYEEVGHGVLKLVYKCLFKEIDRCVSDGCLMHLTHLLSLLTTTIRQSSRSQVYEKKALLKMLKLVALLIESYITPLEGMKSENHIFKVVDGILEFMLCILDYPLNSDDLARLSEQYAPAFKLKNSGLSFIGGLLNKDPCVIHAFRGQILCAMDDLIEVSPKDVLSVMFIFFERLGKYQQLDSLAGVPLEESMKICKFFKKTICSSVNGSDLAVLWGVLRCYHRFQHLHESEIANLIDSLSQLLDTETDNILDIPKTTWQSLLGAALISYHKLLLVKKTGLSETSKLLWLAKKNKSSLQVICAVADLFDSSVGIKEDVSKHTVCKFDVNEAAVAINDFADSLGLSNKELRISTLRILSHYPLLDGQLLTSDEPPHKKRKVEDSGLCCENSQSINVINLLLSAETIPLEPAASRKIVNVVSRLQKGLSAGCINNGYMPLVLHGLLGMLHNRLSYLWQPVSECLGVLLSKYKDLVWSRYLKYLENFQLKVLSSEEQSEKRNSETPQPNTLDNCFSLFLAPDSDSTPCVTVLNQLLKSLQEIPELAESRSKDLIPLFLKFLGYADEKLSRVEAFHPHCCSGREWRLVLKEWLILLKLMRNARSFYRSQFLKEVLVNRLLHEIDFNVQLQVLDCLLNWKDDFLIPYYQHLKNLIMSKNLREELTIWSVSKDSECIQEGHRSSLIPIVIRLLTPKVLHLKSLASRKHTGVGHRRAILCFLAQLHVEELDLFFRLLLEPLLQNPLRADITNSYFDSPAEKSLERSHSSPLVRCSSSIVLANHSWKKTYGFLHVAEEILRTFDELHIRPFLNLLMTTVTKILESCMLSLATASTEKCAGIGDNSASDLKVLATDVQVPSEHMMRTKLYKDSRSLCLKIIAIALNKYERHDFGSEFWDTFFVSIKPLIESFKQEGSSSQKPSSLFSCFLAMSQSPMLVSLLDREASLVPTVFSILTVKTASDAILSCAHNFIENLLILDKENEDQEEGPIKRILLPHLPVLIDCFHSLFQSREKVQRKSAIWSGKSELRIFKLLVKYISDSSAAERFINILLPMFKKQALNSDKCLEGLHIVKAILPVMSEKTTGKVLSAVHPLLVSGGLEIRLCICDILDGLSQIDMSLVILARLLHELNAMSSSEFDEPDYDRRLSAYGSIKPDTFCSFKEEHALTILSHCLYDMSSDDLILRQSASKSLLSFVQFAASVLNSSSDDCEEILSHNQVIEGKTESDLKTDDIGITWTKTCIQRIIKRTFLRNIGEAMSKDISIQKEWIVLMREMVYHLHQIPSLKSLRTLCSEDPEVDFFNNILHLQLHRRGRALSRFRNAISAGGLAENTTVKVFVPLFFNMMFDVKDGKGEHIRNACLATLASISAQLQWEPYRIFLMRCFKEMKCKPDKGKIMIRLICEVLDMFHFFVAETSATVKDCGLEDLSTDNFKGNYNATLATCSESNIPSDIQICLQKLVFPKVMRLMALDSEKVNVNVSLAALKLLKLLPEETMEAQLPTIIHRICNFLKNRLDSIRVAARSALASCAKELGMEKLQLIVKVLKATLKRGFELHVLGYTLNFILSKMLVQPSVGKIDYCLEELLSIAENDILGEVAEEKEVDKIASKMKETRKRKSFETLELVSQNITFRTHAVKLLTPVRAHLEKHLTPRMKAKLEQMLYHIALGIECNPSADPAELFIFVYGLIEDGIIMEESLCQDRSETSIRKTATEVSEKKNIFGLCGSRNYHLIIVFALRLLHSRLKKMKLNKKDEQLLSMLDPFVVLLGKCLGSKYEDVMSAAFRCIAPVIKLPLPSLEAQADKIKLLLLDIAQKSGDSTSPLLQSCLKLLTVLLKSTRISISHDQLHMLIQFPLFIDLQTNQSQVALSLLKSIVGRKLVVHEIYDVVSRVSELMVISQSEPIRRMCSQILLQFLLDYPLSEKRLQQHIDLLLTNLSYEYPSGREAVLEMLHAILLKFPKSVIDNQAQTFFFPLVVALANERDQKVQSMVSTVLKELIARTSLPELNLILGYSLSWYMGGNECLWSAAAQVLGLLVKSLKKMFQKHISSILEVARNILISSINTTSLSNESASLRQNAAYHSLIMLEAMLVHFHHLYYDGNLEGLWDIILKVLLHPCVRLRTISNRLVALHFATISEAGRANLDSRKLGALYLANPSRLLLIAASLLNQLKAQIADDDAASNLIKQNLVFSICNLHSFAKQMSALLLHEYWSTLDPRSQSSYLEAFQLIGSSKAKDLFVLATTEKDYSDHDSSKSLQSLLVAPLLKRMGKIAMDMEDVQMKVIFSCFRMVASKIGSEGCQHYAFYLLISLYKVCEGFAGKAIGDDIKQLAEEVRDGIRDILSVDNFVQVYNQIRKKLKERRDKRKHDQKIIAVVNPMRHAKRKLRLAEKHRAHKKRKITALKVSKRMR